MFQLEYYAQTWTQWGGISLSLLHFEIPFDDISTFEFVIIFVLFHFCLYFWYAYIESKCKNLQQKGQNGSIQRVTDIWWTWLNAQNLSLEF